MQRPSSYRKLKDLPPGSVRWTGGFWADRFERVRTTTLPSMRQAMDNPQNGAVFGNFYVAAGLKAGEHTGTFWSDGDCYKWMEAVAHVYGVTRDPALDHTLDDLIEVIANAQDPDGYICTQIQLTGKKRWQRRRHHELYNMGHLMTAAGVHYRVTGKDNFLAIAKKLADYLVAVFEPRPSELAHYGWNPSNIMGLVDLYRATDDARYLELADIFVSMRGSAPQDFAHQGDYALTDGGDQNQDRVPLREETNAVGHAVTATYLYCGAADVYAETGDQAILKALEQIWQDVVSRKMYITGGVGPLHNGVSGRGDMVHEAFDLPYRLPNATAYNETCANIGNAMWNWRMLNVTGQARYTDLVEQVIYNSGLSPISIDGQHFCYTNPLRWHGEGHDTLSHDTAARWRTHDCYCCPPQVARTIARMQNWAYSLSDGALWVHLYGSNHLETTLNDGTSLALVQESDYPWDGKVTIEIEAAPERPFSLMLHIPGWAKDATLAFNSEPVAAQAGTYAAVQRIWSPGDVIELNLPLDAHLVIGHPQVEETRNQAAVMRGPVVYCLESIDLPADVPMNEVHLPRDVELAPHAAPDLLGGVTVLTGQACRVKAADWTGRLYGELDTAAPTEAQRIQLIPYFAWNNRGLTQMTVWLPLYE